MKNLHFSEKSELVSKLLACPSMKARETRKTILRQLRDEISSQIPFDERDNAYITNVVDTCLNYKGGLEELVDIIQYYERNSRSIDEIDAFLESMFPISIRQARLREL